MSTPSLSFRPSRSSLLIILLLINCQCLAQKHKKNRNEISKIIIKAVSFGISTESNVTCNNFESSFSRRINTVEIVDSVVIKTLIEELSYTEEFPSNITDFLDTRAKIEIFYKSGEFDLYCLGKMRYLTNNNKSMVLKSTVLNQLVDSLTSSTRNSSLR